MRTKSEQGMPVSSVASATRYVRRMAEIETRGFGDDELALRRLEAKLETAPKPVQPSLFEAA